MGEGHTDLRHVHFLVKTYAKTKELDPVGEGARRRRPPWIPQWKVPTHANVVTGLTVINHGEEKAFVLLQKNTKGCGILRCLDTRGNQVWKISPQPLDGKLFVPSGLCTDQNGHIFVIDYEDNRIQWQIQDFL